MPKVKIDTTNMWDSFEEINEGFNKTIKHSLKFAEKTCKEKYKQYTDKRVGKRIKSSHISSMLVTEVPKMKSKSKKQGSYQVNVFLKGTKKWLKIADKQEIGGVIRPAQSKVLAIPNTKAGVSPNAVPRNFGNRASWVNLGSSAALIRKQHTGAIAKKRAPRSPIKVKRRNKPRSKNQLVQRSDILFWGVPSVYLKPKKFFEYSMRDAAVVINKHLEYSLRAYYDRL